MEDTMDRTKCPKCGYMTKDMERHNFYHGLYGAMEKKRNEAVKGDAPMCEDCEAARKRADMLDEVNWNEFIEKKARITAEYYEKKVNALAELNGVLKKCKGEKRG